MTIIKSQSSAYSKHITMWFIKKITMTLYLLSAISNLCFYAEPWYYEGSVFLGGLV